MYIFATFEYSTSLELALKDVENKGISRQDILCLPLDKRVNNEKFFDTIHRTDGRSTMGIPFVLATFLSLFGAIYGFIWKWGPIIWGGLGFLSGIFIGFIVMFIINKLQNKKNTKNSLAEVIVMIRCDEKEEEEITKLLWDEFALGISRFYS